MGFFQEAVRGAGWMGGLRALMRLATFIRIAVLARILLPAQFGAFGIATLVLAFLEIFTETGINVFLVQEKRDIDRFINTAWVVSIARGIFIGLAIFAAAPLIASFFATPAAYQLIVLISLVPLIRGFINPSIVKFQKELKFDREFRFRSSLVVVEVVVAVVLAYLTRSASSLVWAMIASALLEVGLSFLVVSPRPKLAFEIQKVREIVGRGKWVTAAGIFNYLAQQGDDAVVAKILDAASLGLYQLAYKLSTLPLTEVTQVVGKVTFPVYVRITADRPQLKDSFIKTSLVVALLIVPFGLVLFAFPREIVAIVLGPNWLPAAPALRVLAVFGIIRALYDVPNALFLAVEKQKLVAQVTFIQFVGLAAAVVPLTAAFGIVGAAYASVISALFPLPFVAYQLVKILSGSRQK